MPKAGEELISLLVPMYNEEAVLDLFFASVDAAVAGLNCRFEFICVNDGSRDATLANLLGRASSDPRIVVVDLSRNFGKEAALTAALDFAAGDAVIPIDADLQDPPELIGQFIEKWREGYDVVYGVRRTRRSDTPAKRLTAGLFYGLFNRISDTKIPPDVGDFRLIDRAVVEDIKRLPERNRFMKGLFAWVGYRQIGLEFTRPARAAGDTSWNYWKLWNFAIEGITSFSAAPLKVWSYLGLGIAFLGCAYAAILVTLALTGFIKAPGYASIMVAVLILGGLQLMSLGLIGEYIGRLYVEAKQRPPYLVSRVYGRDAPRARRGTPRSAAKA